MHEPCTLEVVTLPSVIIAFMALIFTVASFWWLQARKGKLKLYPVTTFSGEATNHTFVLRVPIIIYNTGAIPRVVTGMRLRWQGDQTQVFECHSFRKTIKATEGDQDDYVHPYVVPGRSVITKHAHFIAEGFGQYLSSQPSTFLLEITVDASTTWKVLDSVTLHTEIMNEMSYVSYTNNSGLWPDGAESEGRQHREKLADMRATAAARLNS